MKQKSRMEYSIMNSGISFVLFFFNMLIKFGFRSIFIKYLGAEYLGLNGLFTNVLNVLSLAELGIGSSIIYVLYKPLAEKNNNEINALMHLYKKIYQFIGLVVAVLGLMILPFLPIIIGKNANIENIYLIYILFLFNSVASYFYTYNRSLLLADQKVYVTVIYDFIFMILTIISQIFILIFTKNYILYLIIQVIFTILCNVFLTIRVKKDYAFLSDEKNYSLSQSTKDILKRNTIGNIANKIGSVVVSGTDNILISAFVSLSAVGFYSNYSLIITSLQQLFTKFTNSIGSSIGNVAASVKDDTGYQVFRKHSLINFFIVYITTTELIVLLNPFISFWVGSNFKMDNFTVRVIILNYVVRMLRNTPQVFIDGYGLAWQQRWKAVFESIINLFTSLLFIIVFKFGVAGVLLGTLTSSLLTVFWYEPYSVFRYAFKKEFILYWKMMFHYSLCFLATVPFIFFIKSFFIEGNLLQIVILAFIVGIIDCLIFLAFFFKTEEFKFLLSVMKKYLRIKIK